MYPTGVLCPQQYELYELVFGLINIKRPPYVVQISLAMECSSYIHEPIYTISSCYVFGLEVLLKLSEFLYLVLSMTTVSQLRFESSIL